MKISDLFTICVPLNEACECIFEIRVCRLLLTVNMAIEEKKEKFLNSDQNFRFKKNLCRRLQQPSTGEPYFHSEIDFRMKNLK